MNDDRTALRECVETYVERHPEASLARVLGRFRLDPDGAGRGVVEDVLADPGRRVLVADGGREPEPIGGDEDTAPMFRCPDPECSTAKATAAKAAAHCAGDDADPPQENGDSAVDGSPDPEEPGSGLADPRGRADTSASADTERGPWADADFTAPESGVWPSALLEREQWMGHVDKKPFAPWADRDHPEANADEDARWKWGLAENYADGETVAMAEADPRLDGRAFLQQHDDPFAYVDGDDVRDPETGDVHPAFLAVLDRLGLTYADVSTSDSGTHAQYRGALPEGVPQAAWPLDTEPWGANDEGDLPSVEIYAGKRVCVATGKHVPGTPTEVREWDDDALREVLDENDQLPDRGERHAGEREEFDLDNYDPDATGADEVTGDIRDVYAAIDALDTQHVADETIVHHWNDDASTSDGTRAFSPTWGKNSNGTANIVDDQIWQDTGDEAGYGGPVVMALIDAGEMSHREASPRRATGATWYDGVDHLRELGFAVPVHVPEAGDENSASEEYDETPLRALRKAAVALDVCGSEEFKEHETDGGETYLGFDRETYNATLDALEAAGVEHGREHIDGEVSNGGVPGFSQQYGVENCAPPEYDPEPFDKEQRRAGLRGECYQRWLDDDRPVRILRYRPGVGKTTGAGLGAADRDRPHAMLADKHAKGREYVTDGATPDDYHQIRGGEQPRHDCCMDAVVDAPEGETPDCPVHGHPAEWDRMCPVYEREPDDPLRERHEALLAAVGPMATHLKLGLFDADEHNWHGEDCRWHTVLDDLDDAERVVGVHEYQMLKTVREGENVGDRDLFVDESPRAPGRTQRVSVAGLVRAKLRLDDLADLPGRDPDRADGLRAFAAFADRLVGALADDAPVDLDDVAPPDLAGAWDTYREVMDPISGEYVERDLEDETLAQLKLVYTESTVRRVEADEWDGAPLCFDALLAAGAAAGLDDDAARRAIAVPPVLDACPWCGSELAHANGARRCGSDTCEWDEREHSVTRRDGEQARALAWLDDDLRDLDRDEEPALAFRALPPASAMPENGPLVLDATATPERVAGLYGRRVDDVDVEGDDPLDLDGKLHLTQVYNGQYHRGTIEESPRARRLIQKKIDAAGEFYDRPLFGIQRALLDLFDFPENGEVLIYGGARGLNRADCDAVVCIGAPHPDMDALRREAELLAMDHPDLDVGGVEHSTRRGADGEIAEREPVYRKLLYADENGDGRAVATKHYSGLVGALFREAREKELEQFVHRTRPLLVDPDAGEEPVDAYLLTNVPTDLPVDEVCSFDELAGDLSAVFPVPEGALDLARAVARQADGLGPDGFRPGALVERRADGTVTNDRKELTRLARVAGVTARGKDEPPCYETVVNWVDALEAVGLLDPEEYEQRRGVVYAADSATLESALQVISRNGFSNVAAVRRFREKVAASDGALDWLEWAQAVFDLAGDRCEWDPPPTPVG